jgi:hypothetical protein
LLAVLKAAKVNLLAFTGFPEGGGAQLDFVPQDNAKFLKAARAAKLRISARKTAFLLQGDDRVGALSSAMGRLAKAKINVVSIQAVTAGKRRFGAILWVKPKDVAKAARALRAR